MEVEKYDKMNGASLRSRMRPCLSGFLTFAVWNVYQEGYEENRIQNSERKFHGRTDG